MASDKTVWVEIFKYPITIFSILVSLIIGTYLLGIKWGSVSEISKDGIKFTQEAKGELTDLSSKLNGALAAIEELKKHIPSAQANSSQILSAVSEAEQTVSDQTAQLSKLQPNSNGSSSQTGYIFIGNYKGEWRAVKLAALDTGQPISLPPQQLQPGTSYEVLDNMVVRDSLPSNDGSHYKHHRSLGTIPRGTKVRLASAPVSIDRKFAIQYWAKVEIQ
jgi:hypothetical protein